MGSIERGERNVSIDNLECLAQAFESKARRSSDRSVNQPRPARANCQGTPKLGCVLTRVPG